MRKCITAARFLTFIVFSDPKRISRIERGCVMIVNGLYSMKTMNNEKNKKTGIAFAVSCI